MFKQRKQYSFIEKVREFFWPRAGWRRTSNYLYHRAFRLPGTSHNIAAGIACGVAVSFTPFIGLHFALSALLAWTLQGNIVAAIISTAVGNPWTFPFIWVLIYEVGSVLLGQNPAETVIMLPSAGEFYSQILQNPFQAMDSLLPILWPMMLGSVPVGIAVWLLTYFSLRRMVEGYRHARLGRISKAARRAMAKKLAKGDEDAGK